MMDPTRRAQVESALRRPLTEGELVVVTDLAVLPPSHVAVIEQIYRLAPIQAFYYLQAVVENDDPSELRRYVHNFDSFVAKRDKHPMFIGQPACEHQLGRELTADELVSAGSLASITSAQRKVARAIAVKDLDLAVVYLGHLVHRSSREEQQAFLESLARPE